MIFRKTLASKYFVMDNMSVQSDILSFKAKGILTSLMSRPDNWAVTLTALAEMSPKEGIDSVRSGLQELEIAGYATLLPVRINDGTFKGTKWFVSNDKDWVSSLISEGEVTVDENNKIIFNRDGDQPTSVKSNPLSEASDPLDKPSLGSSNATKERTIQSKEIKLHSPDFVPSDHSLASPDYYLQTWQWSVCSEVYDWLEANDLLKGKAKSLDKVEVIMGRGKSKGWWDVADKLHRLDKHDPDAISDGMKWMMFTVNDEDGNENPMNGGFWIYTAGWCSMGTLRKQSRNKEMTQFDQIYSSFDRWNKRRKKK